MLILFFPHLVLSEFQTHIRGYNNAVSFASLGATVDQSVQGHQGFYMFRVTGALYHDMGSVFPEGQDSSAFVQIYVTGGNDIEEARLRAQQSHSPLDESILLRIQNYLTQYKSYA